MNTKHQIDPVVPVSPEKQDAGVLATLGVRVLNQRKTEEHAVAMLGKSMGYGRLMELAQQEWRRELRNSNDVVGSEFAYGPCVALTVVCGCRYEESATSSCDWCCGSGWLTRHVRELQIQQQGTEAATPAHQYSLEMQTVVAAKPTSIEDRLVMRRAILDDLAMEQRRVPEPLNIHSSSTEDGLVLRQHLLSTMDQEVDAADIEPLWPAKAMMLRVDAYLSTNDAPLTEKDVPLLCSLEEDVQMTIKQLHDVLAELTLAGGGLRIITDGFGFGTTYRGDYSQAAFEPVTVTNVSTMYAAVTNMLGGLLQGKNPHPTPVTHDTLVNIAKYNDCGEDDELTPRRLKAMLGVEGA